MRNIFRSLSVVVLLVGALAPFQSGAAPIAVENASFEDVVLSPGGFTVSQPADWTGPGTGTFHPTTQFDAVPDGFNTAYLQAGGSSSLSQTVDVLVTPGSSYTLEVAVGYRADLSEPLEYSIALEADGSVLGSSSVPVPGAGEFLTSTVFVTTTSTTPGLGSPLTIVIRNLSSMSQLNIDDVRLDAVVPEPVAAALLALGAALLGAQRRRGRQLPG